MIDKKQHVKIRWNNHNRKKYENLGYKCTNLSDEFDVEVNHIETNSSIRVKVRCDDCGVEITTPYRNYNRIVNKSGAYRCRKCNAPFVSQIRINNYAEKALEKFNNYIQSIGCKSLATIDDYVGYDTPMPFLCPKHGKQYLSIDQITQKNVCPKCGNEKRGLHYKYDNDRVDRIISSKNNNEWINKDEYINSYTPNLKIRCGSCGNIFVSSLASIKVSGGRCRDCGSKIPGILLRIPRDELISMTTIDGVCTLINPDDYISKDKNNLKFKCILCGEIFTRSLGHYLEGDGRCKKCTKAISIGERRVIDVLDKYDIKYTAQKRFPDCRDKKTPPFDFYLQDYNCCIEFDGYQHYNMMSPYDTEESFNKRKYHDDIKTKYCDDNNIQLIRIPYWEFKNIEEIITDKLNLVQLKDIV